MKIPGDGSPIIPTDMRINQIKALGSKDSKGFLVDGIFRVVYYNYVLNVYY